MQLAPSVQNVVSPLASWLTSSQPLGLGSSLLFRVTVFGPCPFFSIILRVSSMVIMIFFFFWTGLCCILVAACRVLLVAVSEGYPPVALLVLLTVMVSLAAEHSL